LAVTVNKHKVVHYVRPRNIRVHDGSWEEAGAVALKNNQLCEN